MPKKFHARVMQGSLKHKIINKPVSIHGHDNISPQKIKESVFQLISNITQDFNRCLFFDLYSGSGQMGIEALSRGFQHVWFCEIHSKRLKNIREWIDKNSDFSNAGFSLADAFRFIQKTISRKQLSDYLTNDKKPNNIIFFADPPYAEPEKNIAINIKLAKTILEYASRVDTQCTLISQNPYNEITAKKFTDDVDKLFDIAPPPNSSTEEPLKSAYAIDSIKSYEYGDHLVLSIHMDKK